MTAQRRLLAAVATYTISLAPAGALGGIDDLKGTRPGDLLNNGRFADAAGCASCHSVGTGPEASYLPVDTWAGTMMANAALDPVFHAALAVANRDAPGVGTFCLRCHSPVAFVRGHATPPDGTAFDAIDNQGVGCETCHRAEHAPASVSPGAPYLLGDAQLYYSDTTSKHGPYAHASGALSAHDAIQDPALGTSRFCGQCHQVTNPDRMLRGADGRDLGVAFPLDTTYEEWAQSDFGRAGSGMERSCQDCHMLRQEGSFQVGFMIDPPILRTNPRTHSFVGGNHWGIQAVMKANPERAEIHRPSFELTLKRTVENLRRSVTLTVLTPPATVQAGQPFDVNVRVENLTGHKFPSGYADSRQAWIEIALVNSQGAETVVSGRYDDATGEIDATPVPRIYRAWHGRWNNGQAEIEDHLALHDMIVVDTRIPPRGFVPTVTTQPTSHIDYAVGGQAAMRHYDQATLTVTAPTSVTGAHKLRVRVLFQSMTREYIEFLAREGGEAGHRLEEIYNQTDRAPPIEVALAQSDVEVMPPPSLPEPVDGGGDRSAGGAANDPSGCACAMVGGAKGEDSDSGPNGFAWSVVLVLFAVMRRRPQSRRLRHTT
jgi:hypothetical protein